MPLKCHLEVTDWIMYLEDKNMHSEQPKDSYRLSLLNYQHSQFYWLAQQLSGLFRELQAGLSFIDTLHHP